MKFINKKLFSCLLLATLLLGSCTKQLEADYVDKGSYSYKGDGTVDQMLPAPATASTGTATFTATYDINLRIFNYFLAWKGASSQVTKADFYFPSSSVQSGLFVRNMFTSTRLQTDSISGAIWTVNALSNDEVTSLNAGNVYYVISTTLNPTGEIRGKVILNK